MEGRVKYFLRLLEALLREGQKLRQGLPPELHQLAVSHPVGFLPILPRQHPQFRLPR